MLTGTLVTVASFIPVGLNDSAAGEYTFTLFVVIATSLLVSWVVAVVFAPLLGVTILPRKLKAHAEGPGRLASGFGRLLRAAMRWRWLTIALTAAVFAVALYGMRFVEQQFFPSSDRPELVVDVTLPQNAAITETRAQMDRFEAALVGERGHRPLVVLCRPGRDPLRARVRRAGAEPEHRPDHHRQQGSGGPRPREGAAAGLRPRGIRRHRHPGELPAARPPGRSAGAVPRRRPRHRDRAADRARPRHRHRRPPAA